MNDNVGIPLKIDSKFWKGGLHLRRPNQHTKDPGSERSIQNG